MSIERIGIRDDAMKHGGFQKKSTDAWPLPSTHEGVINGSRCYVLDTGALYVYSAENVNSATGNGWWEV